MYNVAADTAHFAVERLTGHHMALLEAGRWEATVARIGVEREGEHPLDAILAWPEPTHDDERFPAIILLPDIFGVRPLFDDIAHRIATNGWCVLAPEPFSRIPRKKREHMDIDARFAAMPDLVDSQQLSDIKACAAYLEAMPECDGHTPGLIGFCAGGYYAFKAAQAGVASAVVSFYGMLRTPPAWDGPGHYGPLDSEPAQTPTLAWFGSLDPWVPAEDVRRFAATWRRPHRSVTIEGADHGFVHDPDRPAHRAQDAAYCWEESLRWLRDPAE